MQASFAQKKEQAKQLLLKGCYRMAANKYSELIGSVPAESDKRTVAVLHLNEGICYQFMEKLDKALQCIGNALGIDPTYDKAYFRKVQILLSLGRFEEALTTTPQGVMNAELAALLDQARKDFAEKIVSREWEGLQPKLVDPTTNEQLLKEIHNRLYHIHVEDEPAAFIKELNEATFFHYVLFLREHSDAGQRLLWRLISVVYKLLVVRKQTTLTNQYQPFMKQVLAVLGTIKPTAQQLVTVIKLAALCQFIGLPNSEHLLLHILNNIGALLDTKASAEALDICLTNNQQLAVSSQLQLTEKEQETLERISVEVGRILQNLIRSENWGSVQHTYSIYHCVRCLLRATTKSTTDDPGSVFLNLLSLKSNLHNEATLSKQQPMKLSVDTMGSLLRTIAQTPLGLEMLWLIDDILEIASNLKEFKTAPFFAEAIQKLKQRLTEQQIKPIVYVMLGSILCKIAYPEDQSKYVDLERVLCPLKSQFHALKCVELLNLLCFTSAAVVGECLKRSEAVYQLILSDVVLLKQATDSLTTVKLKIKLIMFIGSLLIDNEEESQKRYADSMGVDIEKIRSARILQGQSNKQASQKLAKLRIEFMKTCDKIIPALEYLASTHANNLAEANANLKSVLSRVAKIHPQRLLNSSYLDLMLSTPNADKFAQEDVYVFFSQVCRKVNPQQLLYRHQLPICRVLLEAIQKASHQLIIFESLLALVNLSTLSLDNLDIRPVCRLLMEQNEYILHGTLECLNNFILKGQHYYKQINQKDFEIIDAMLRHYRKQLNEASDKPPTDYSHPHKLYLTLVSLQMVLEDYKQVDVQELRDFEFLCQHISKLNEAERLQLLTKGLIYHSHKGTLNKQLVLATFRSDLERLRQTSPDKFKSISKMLGL